MMLRVENLSKEYSAGGFRLGPIDWQLASGETVCVFGKNGAGKSTLFQLLSGNLDASAGEILLNDKKLTPDKYELRRQMGYLPQNLEFPRWVSGRELLSYAASLYELPQPKERVEDTLRFWDSDAFAFKPLQALSHGMQKRIALGLACLHEPDFLILDEPFSGLDIFHIHALEETIQKRRTQGKTTIISTHELLYAAKLCDHAVALEAGQMRSLPAWSKQEVMERIQSVETFFFKQG